MSTETHAGTQPAETKPPKRTRRAEPISKRTARDGTVSYTFQADVGTKPDGSRDRRRTTCTTLAEARKEYRRITTEVAQGTYNRPTAITVDQACDAWLEGSRHRIREVTMTHYRNVLQPVRRYLGGKKLQQLTKADGDALVQWMLTEGRCSPAHHLSDSRNARVAAFVAAHPEGVSTAAIRAEFPGEDTATCLAGLLRSGRVTRPRRAFYVAAEPAEEQGARGGVKAVSVRATLIAFRAVVQTYMDQGVLPRNVIALVDRPRDQASGGTGTAKSWTLAEVQTFRESVRDEQLFACWLLSMYGLRRSEVLGLRWLDIDDDTLRIRQSRIAVGGHSVVDEPKSKRGTRDLPMPAELSDALRALKISQKREALALGVAWSDDRLIAVHQDGTLVRPEWYSDQFHRLRERAGLRRIKLHGLRNTSVSLMLDQGIPVHIVAAWHGHHPATALAIYSEAKANELRAAGASLFG
ncbi:MAG: site-specific integrase [Actinomycetia bacterium]|nr:site-specific integrase [Actinomycetes bacterium]